MDRIEDRVHPCVQPLGHLREGRSEARIPRTTPACIAIVSAHTAHAPGRPALRTRAWSSHPRSCGHARRAEADISNFIHAEDQHPDAVTFMHAATKGDPDLIAFGTRLVDANASFESGGTRAARRTSQVGGQDAPAPKRTKHGGALLNATLDELRSFLGESDSDRRLAAAAEQSARAATTAAKGKLLGAFLANRPHLTEDEEEALRAVMPGIIAGLAGAVDTPVASDDVAGAAGEEDAG